MISKNTIEQLKRHLRDVVEATTERSKGANMYVCPFCGSGRGKSKTGALSLDAKKHYTEWHCFACEAGDLKPYHGDVFDYVGRLYNIPEFWARVRKAAEICGVKVEEETIDETDPTIGPWLRKAAAMRKQGAQAAAGGAAASAAASGTTAPAARGQDNARPTPAGAAQGAPIGAGMAAAPGTAAPTDRAQAAAPEAEKPAADYTEFFAQAARNLAELSDADFSRVSRGISRDTCRRFNVGYVPNWKHPNPNVPEWARSPRLIIPTSSESYIARDVRSDEDIPERERAYKKQKVGPVHLFNADALKRADKPTVITEAEIDALSADDAGGGAVNVCALGSTTMKTRMAAMIKHIKPKQPLIIALDNDAAGEAAAAYLERACVVEGVFSLMADTKELYGGAKDANEALQANREALAAQILVLADEARGAKSDAEASEQQELIDSISVEKVFPRFFERIKESGGKPRIPTGFPVFDKVMNGGIYAGLICIGAVSSLGKTTFVMQIADQIAQSGRDVLIFSLEMSQFELMAKSISRHTAQIVGRDETLSPYYQKNALEILDGNKYADYVREGSFKTIADAANEYGKYVHHLYISEGHGDVGVTQVRNTVLQFVNCRGGSAPVVIVDYLQILAPEDAKSTDKQNTDKAVTELRRISRDFNTPVIAISSFNRENYAKPVNMACFKESGGIEYSSDILIGLQFTAADRADSNNPWNENAEKSKVPREIQAVILKNRFGRIGAKIEYRFFSEYNLFEELPDHKQRGLYGGDGGFSSQENAAQNDAAARSKRGKKKRTAREVVEESQAQARADKTTMRLDMLAERGAL